MLYLDTTMLWKFENENKNQNKKNLGLKIYGKIRDGRLKLEPSVLIKETCTLTTLSNGIFKIQTAQKHANSAIFGTT